jgi:hypothetical protein
MPEGNGNAIPSAAKAAVLIISAARPKSCSSQSHALPKTAIVRAFYCAAFRRASVAPTVFVVSTRPKGNLPGRRGARPWCLREGCSWFQERLREMVFVARSLLALHLFVLSRQRRLVCLSRGQVPAGDGRGLF